MMTAMDVPNPFPMIVTWEATVRYLYQYYLYGETGVKYLQ
jgi:hypothetical protein